MMDDMSSATVATDLAVHYLNNINGKFGIGSKKIISSIEESLKILKMSREREIKFLKKSNANKNTKLICLNEQLHAKDPLPNLQKEKIIVLSNDDHKLNKMEKNATSSNTFWRKTKKKLNLSGWYKIVDHNTKVRVLSINKNLIDSMNLEINAINKSPCNRSSKNKSTSNWYPHNSNHFSGINHVPIQYTSALFDVAPDIAKKKEKEQNRLPYVIRSLLSKNKTISPSEQMTSRYRKQKVNLEEILMHHNSNIRKDIRSRPIGEFQMKKSIKFTNIRLYKGKPRSENFSQHSQKVSSIFIE